MNNVKEWKTRVMNKMEKHKAVKFVRTKSDWIEKKKRRITKKRKMHIKKIVKSHKVFM